MFPLFEGAARLPIKAVPALIGDKSNRLTAMRTGTSKAVVGTPRLAVFHVRHQRTFQPFLHKGKLAGVFLLGGVIKLSMLPRATSGTRLGPLRTHGEKNPSRIIFAQAHCEVMAVVVKAVKRQLPFWLG